MNKNLIIILGASIIGVLIFSYLSLFGNFVNAQDNSGLVTVSATSTAAIDNSEFDFTTQKFIRQVGVLNNVTVDGSFFQNPSFLSLVDMSVPIPAEQSGRNNPFAPL